MRNISIFVVHEISLLKKIFKGNLTKIDLKISIVIPEPKIQPSESTE